MLRENGGIQAPSHARLSQHGPLPRITLVEVRPGPPQSWGSQGCWKISLLENEVREHSTSGRCYSHKRSRRLSRVGASNQVSPLVDPFLQENWQRGDSTDDSSAAQKPTTHRFSPSNSEDRTVFFGVPDGAHPRESALVSQLFGTQDNSGNGFSWDQTILVKTTVRSGLQDNLRTQLLSKFEVKKELETSAQA